MAKKKAQTGGGDNAAVSGGRVLYAALFIILLAFFIVLNAIGVHDEKNTLAALGSLTGSFGILPGGLSTSKEGEVRVMSSERTPMESREAESLEIQGLGRSGKGAVEIRETPHGEVVSIQDRLLFDERSYKIKLGAYGFLKSLCEVINQDQYPVEITGHTDDMAPDENSVYSNQEISSLRALEVFKFFVVIGKVPPSRLIAYGCGQYRPVASNETRQTRALNRRVDVLLTKKASGLLKGIYQKDPSALVVFKRFVFRVLD
jgi:chemotaxis protein MotB